MRKKTIPSGFETIDTPTGGLKKGGLFLVRTLETEGEELQEFICAEIRKLTVEGNLSILVVSLSMDRKELIKELLRNQTQEQIKELANRSIYVAEKYGINDIDTLQETMTQFSEDKKIDAIVIDGIETVLPADETDSRAIKNLIELAKDTGTAVIISDYDGHLDVGYPRPDEVTEMEIKTDINDIVQAAIYTNKRKIIIEDLYGFWKIFNKILTNNEKK